MNTPLKGISSHNFSIAQLFLLRERLSIVESHLLDDGTVTGNEKQQEMNTLRYVSWSSGQIQDYLLPDSPAPRRSILISRLYAIDRQGI